MTINLISCVYFYKNKLAIGKDASLLFKLKDDMSFFKNITTNSLSQNSLLDANVLLMGRRTFETTGLLKKRYNIILTSNPDLINIYSFKYTVKLDINKPYYMNFKTFIEFYHKFNPNVFVIGGGEVYNQFLAFNEFMHPELIPTKLYITEVKTKVKDLQPNVFMNAFEKYSLIGYSEKYTTENENFRILHYTLTDKPSQEYKYLDLAKYILENGNDRLDRTGTGTIGIFGAQLRFDISNGNLPLLTTKQVPLKAIIEELLFFCRGDTDTKILDRKGVKIWNGNTSREFLDNRGLSHYPEGIMGPMYGFSWRHFGAKYDQSFSDTSKIDTSLIGGVDQLQNVIHLLKTDPFSRRIYISNLNPAESQNMCLDMCHTYIQFYVEEINGIKYLSGYFTMRSSDYFLAAVSFNLISYALLVYILALKCNMKPKEIIYNSVDCHIYKNHIEQIKEQIKRTPRPFPHIKLNSNLKDKDWSEMEYSDFELIGYIPFPSIKAPMAI